MKKIGAMVFLYTAVLCMPVLAEEGEQTVFDRAPSALGAVFGDVSGTGLNYHRWLGRLGLSAAAGVYYSPDGNFYLPVTGSGNTTYDLVDPVTGDVYSDMGTYYTTLWYNIGLEAQYMMYEEDFADWFSGCLYLFFGVNHNARGKYSYATNLVESEYVPGDYYWEEDRTNRTDHPVEFNLNTGLGIGIEPVFFGHFSFPMEFGYVAFINNMQPDLDHITILFTFQAGFRYRF